MPIKDDFRLLAQHQLDANLGIKRMEDVAIAAQRAAKEGRSRIATLIKEQIRMKKEQRAGDERVGTTKLSKVARLIGKPQLAQFLDTMFGQYVDPRELVYKRKKAAFEEQLQKKQGGSQADWERKNFGETFEEWVAKEYPDEAKKSKGKKGKRVKRESTGTTTTSSGEQFAFARTYRIMTATHNYIRKIDDNVIDITDDISDIKNLIKPRAVVARGGAVKDAWGRTDTSAKGQIQFAHYNPLAPAGHQFVESRKAWSKHGRGFYTQGGPSTKELGKEFVESAMKKAAVQTAILMMKMEAKDKKRAESRLKRQAYNLEHGFVERKETDPLVPSTPLELFRQETNKNFKKVFKMLKGIDGGKDSLVDNLIEGMAGGLTAGAVGATAGAAAGKRAVLGRAMTTLFTSAFSGPAFIGALAAAIPAAMLWGMDKSMKGGAEKAIDAVLKDVTRKIGEQEAHTQSTMSDEHKYKMYREAMRKAFYSEGEERAKFKLLQWVTSPNLTDEERGYGIRFNNEMESGTVHPVTTAPEPPKPSSATATSVTAGPAGRTRGGTRRKNFNIQSDPRRGKIIRSQGDTGMITTPQSSGRTNLESAMNEAGITGAHRTSLLAQAHHESGGFMNLEEGFDFSADRLMEVFPKYYKNRRDAEADAGNPQKIANRVYGGRLGNTGRSDGWKYRGRGYIQLTGKDNYRIFGKLIGVDLVRNPDLAADPNIAAKLAAAYYKNRVIEQGISADDLRGVTKAIQGGSLGLMERGKLTAMYNQESTLRGTASPSITMPSGVDAQSRAFLAANSQRGVAPSGASSVVLDNSRRTIQTVANQPVTSGSSTSRDQSLLRAANRDAAVHPAVGL